MGSRWPLIAHRPPAMATMSAIVLPRKPVTRAVHSCSPPSSPPQDSPFAFRQRRGASQCGAAEGKEMTRFFFATNCNDKKAS